MKKLSILIVLLLLLGALALTATAITVEGDGVTVEGELNYDGLRDVPCSATKGVMHAPVQRALHVINLWLSQGTAVHCL